MGDQRREDTAKAQREDVDPARNADADAEHEDGFDTKHAQKQLQMRKQARGDVYLDLPEREFEGTGDQDRLRERFDALVAAGNLASEEVLEIVRDMDGPNRGYVRAQLGPLAKITTGGDLLVLAELTSSELGPAVDAALACATKPTAAQMRAYLSRLDDYLIKQHLGDAPTVKKLSETYDSAIAVLPRLPELLDNAHLASWYLNHTPSEQVALAMLRVEDRHTAKRLAKHLNAVGKQGAGGWQWAFHVTDAMTAINSSVVEAYAKESTLPSAAAFLQQKYDTYEGSLAHLSFGKTEREVDAELKRGKPDIEAVVDDIAQVVGEGADELRKHRARFLAHATTSQIDLATQLANFKPEERLAWLLDGKKVKVEELRDALASWRDEDVEAALDDKHVTKIRKQWPKASPADVFGQVPMTLYGSLAKSTAVRSWIATTGQPNDILHLLAFWPGRTAEMSKWVDAHVGWDWLDQLGGGVHDHELRVLALHCPDKAIVERIEKYLLGDTYDAASITTKPQAFDRAATEDPNDRFDRELRFKKDRDLADTAGELRAEDVAELRRDPEKLKKAIANTKGKHLVRMLYLLEPPLRLLLSRGGEVGEVDAVQLAGWVRTRPGRDVIDAFSDPAAANTAMKLWPTAPLEIFPQLRKADVLSPVLEANTDVLRWIVEHSEPMSALHAIAASGVAKATVAALEDDRSVLDLLPSGQRLSPRERTYLYGLANNATGRLKQRITARIEASESEEDTDVDERAVGEDRRARDKAGFAEALEMLLDDSEARVDDILTLCRERAAEAEKLVSHAPELAARTLARTGQSPQVVFATVPFDVLLGRPKLVEPTFDSVPGFVILRAAATNGALAGVLARGLDAKTRPFVAWVRALPSASGLSTAEHTALKKIFAGVKDDETARDVFKARFGAPASDDYSRDEIQRLWSTLERLPRSHTDQGAVAGYQEMNRPLDGEFDPASRTVLLKEKLIKREGDTDTNGVYDRQDAASTEMTADQAKAAFGLDDEQLKQWIAAGRLELDNGVYTVNPQPQPDRFTGTALHEVGHAVDQMLGNNTELVFGLADWKQYGDADFDAWANELGDWDRVTPEDKKQIRDAWKLWSNSTQAAGRPPKGLHELVAFDHPAVKSGYAGVGVVDFVNDPDQRGDSGKPFLRNGRAYIMNGVYQRKYSLPLRTLHSAPSQYSLTAPEEYFAECYMTYYLTYDGTPQTAGDKGKLLAPWIKKWFEENIDKVGHNPKKGSY